MRRLDTGGGAGENGSGAEDSVISLSGMSGFHLYNQIPADVFGCDILLGDSGEFTALGAWAAGASSLGFYPDAHSAWKEAVSSAAELRFSPRGEITEHYGRSPKHRESADFEWLT